MQFFTAAHAYYCAKAEFYHESGYYREIKNVLFGHNVYRLGRKIRIDDRWDKVRVGIMRDILQAKMEQCAKYRTRLAKCNGLIVAACHDDDYWYSGAKKEAVLKNGEYPGQNMLGLLHTEMRNEMKDKEEDFPEGITAKAMDSVATASAASSDQAPPAKRQKTDEATQAMNDLLAAIYENSESTERRHSDDDLNFGEPIPVVTTQAQKRPSSTPMPQRTSPPQSTPSPQSTPLPQSTPPPQRTPSPQRTPPPQSTPSPQRTPPQSTLMPSPQSTPASQHTPKTQQSIKTQPLATNASPPPQANQGKCNWCLTVRILLSGKKFCARCSAQGTECAHCHRPMPERFFAYSQRLCNACYKAHVKLKAKRRMKRL